MQLQEGNQLQNGKFRIIRVLGKGGFGITYLAENTFLGRKFAIKEFFPKDFCGRNDTNHLTIGTENNRGTVEKLKARFLKEARNIAKLDHPGIITIHDIFEENDTAYYVMEFIEGDNLHEIIKREGALPKEVATSYIKQIGEALSYIHEKNMTHFDVKPSNVMIRISDNAPVLIDFGLSKQYDRHGIATSTLIQAVSQGFSPMELYNPGSINEFSPQTDIYSLGATLYYLSLGKTPPTPSEIIEDGLNIPLNLDDKIVDFIKKSMQITRAKRPSSISDALKLLPVFEEKTKETSNNKTTNQEETILINPSSQKPNSRKTNLSSLDEKISRLNKEITELLAKIVERDKDANELKAKLAYNETQRKDLESNIAELKKKNNELKKTSQNWKTEYDALQSTVNELEESKKSIISSRNIFSGLFVAAVIGLFISIPMCSHNYSELSDVNMDIVNLENNISSLKNQLATKTEEIESQKKLISTIAGSQSVFVESMEVRNEGENYDAKIYSKNSTYINPRIKVLNLSNSSKTLGIKFFAPYGLSTGSSSQNGYSFTEDVPANYNGWYEIIGWGGNDKGHWHPGKYRIEIWSDGKCIYKHPFTIY